MKLHHIWDKFSSKKTIVSLISSIQFKFCSHPIVSVRSNQYYYQLIGP